MQKAEGYLTTWVAGEQEQREGEITAARPGRLVSMGQVWAALENKARQPSQVPGFVVCGG